LLTFFIRFFLSFCFRVFSITGKSITEYQSGKQAPDLQNKTQLI
jgi:hypothetical protein